jgi:Arc/MetJ-type ribon-helix-helix transcriptional regulator
MKKLGYPENYNIFVGLTLPMKTVDKITDLAYRHRIKSRSDVIRQLIDVGLFIESKMGLVETWTSEDMQAIKEQIESGQLVDWVAQLDHKKFQNIMHIFDDETKTRKIRQQKLTE